MGRYYFHLDDGRCDPDGEGTELWSDEEARREAMRYAGEVLRDRPDLLGAGLLRVNVRNHEGVRLCTVEVRVRVP